MSESRDIALSCSGLSKQYFLGEQSNVFTLTELLAKKFRESLGFSPKSKKEKPSFSALDDISFDLHKGQVLGVIGKNGSGKSTLLKILSRITPPSQGEFHYNGSIASLLEVGTGFKQELTGWDNIFLNGTALGLKKKKIFEKIDEIIDFAEIHDFIHTPVKRYSSGMYVRLAFAVAAHLEPDIMLLDEVLAVGDSRFQKKCLKKMGSIATEGRTVIFVSHNMQAVTQLCDKAILLEGGKLIEQGEVGEVVNTYMSRSSEQCQSGGKFTFSPSPKKPATIDSIHLGHEGSERLHFDILEAIPITVRYSLKEDFKDLQLHLSVSSLDGLCIYTSSIIDGSNFEISEKHITLALKQGSYVATSTLPAPLLNSGFYELSFYLLAPGDRVFDQVDDLQIEVSDHKNSFASCIRHAKRSGATVVPLNWSNRKA